MDKGYRVTPAAVTWRGGLEAAARVVAEWQPGRMSSEKECQVSLFDHLKAHIPESAFIRREWGLEGGRCDIFMKLAGIFGGVDEVVVEMKLNLKSVTDYDRLVGQIERLNPKERNIIIVLCGDSDAGFCAELREKYGADKIWNTPYSPTYATVAAVNDIVMENVVVIQVRSLPSD